MLQHTEKIRVRYGETDQMGYVYYGNYALYFEVARTALMRILGVSYAELESKGIGLPVLEMKTKYIRPAVYDDELDVIVTVKEIPKARITFHYEIKKGEELINLAECTLVFIDMETGKARRAPDEIEENLAPFFN